LAFLHKIIKKLIVFLENKKCYLASFVPDLKKTLGHSHSMVFNLFFLSLYLTDYDEKNNALKVMVVHNTVKI
jgi:hypothetical protein